MFILPHTRDHDDVTFLNQRVERIFMAIRDRRIELTQSQTDTPIDETELYLFVVEREDKGRTYGLGWTPSGSRRRHAGAGAGSSRPMSTNDEPIEQLKGDIKEMQRSLLRVIYDKTLNREQSQETYGRLGCMEQALMDILRISFVPPAHIDDDSETDQNLYD
ncbi:hypothetical protein Scep_024225 [Stephania cephalantha]|uniref:Uncharacterized protein n=1 Tax=Stephania cephalantha TaxID=152367 RepID=A0AAP0EW59_9MAGN